jgi:undecaprenyl-diphosphatase
LTLLQAIILGVVQGATEFIPVSSSGHLVIVPWLLGWQPSGLTFTVVAHLGTATGVLIFFWNDWKKMAQSAFRWLRTGKAGEGTQLMGLIVLGTIPTAIVGLLFQKQLEGLFDHPLVAILMLLVTALLLTIGERIGKLRRDVDDMTWIDSLIIGGTQVIAIVPGISRSGSTIAAGRARDLKRADAARFSFLLATPLILGIGTVEMTQLIQAGSDMNQIVPLLAGFAAALISTYFVIRWLLNYLRTRSTIVFAVYCVAASLISLAVFFIRTG